MTRNRAGAWRSVETTEIRRNVKVIGAYYRQELARRLIEKGFRIERTMIGGVPGFEIAGYPRALLDAFSSRRREILAWLDKHGLPWSAALTRQAALITRRRKADRDIDTLRADWRARAERLGVSRDPGIARPGRGKSAAGKAVYITGPRKCSRTSARSPASSMSSQSCRHSRWVQAKRRWLTGMRNWDDCLMKSRRRVSEVRMACSGLGMGAVRTLSGPMDRTPPKATPDSW